MGTANKEKAWCDTKKKYHLSRDTILMAKKLGLNPKKFGSIANHKQEPWKAPLPDFIRSLYEKRFNKSGNNKDMTHSPRPDDERQIANKPQQIYQFKITLEDIEPKIWRRIQVPEKYSFWDLHVAIQDSMGWTNSHMHQFKLIIPNGNEEIHIGIPFDEDIYAGELPPVIAGWEEFISHYFSIKNNLCYYEYDFGDGWTHEIKLEKILPATAGCKYPICLAGERACPPEDCGGIPGYENFLEIINDSKHEEHESMLEWVGGKFDSEKFDPVKVRFDNPKKRWEYAIGSR